MYADPRVHTYYRNEFGRSATNNPIDIRRIWTWLQDPASRHLVNGKPINHLADSAVRARFGDDLVIE